MRTVDTADWSQSERDGINWGTPYVVTCAPYGETMAREFYYARKKAETTKSPASHATERDAAIFGQLGRNTLRGVVAFP